MAMPTGDIIEVRSATPESQKRPLVQFQHTATLSALSASGC